MGKLGLIGSKITNFVSQTQELKAKALKRRLAPPSPGCTANANREKKEEHCVRTRTVYAKLYAFYADARRILLFFLLPSSIS